MLTLRSMPRRVWEASRSLRDFRSLSLERKVKRSPSPHDRLGPNPAPVSRDNRPARRQLKSNSSPIVAEALEGPKDSLQILSLDARPIIPNGNDPFPCLLASADMNARRCVSALFDRVA